MALSRGHTRAQAERAISISNRFRTETGLTARVLGMLAEAASILGTAEAERVRGTESGPRTISRHMKRRWRPASLRRCEPLFRVPRNALTGVDADRAPTVTGPPSRPSGGLLAGKTVIYWDNGHRHANGRRAAPPRTTVPHPTMRSAAPVSVNHFHPLWFVWLHVGVVGHLRNRRRRKTYLSDSDQI